MCEILTTFMLLYMVLKLHNVHIIHHRFDGIYLYYEVKKFNIWFKDFEPVVKRILLWSKKTKDEEPPIF